MSPERWRHVEELYHRALEQPESARSAFLRQACSDDQELLREVRSLLGYEGPAEGFIEEPAAAAAMRDDGADPQRSWPGRRIGEYEVRSLLGVGGMGEVYRARDCRLGRDVALKVLPAPLADDPERVSRFEREARLLAALNHPNVAVIHGLEELDGHHVLVLELVEGETLAARIARGPIPVAEALPFFVQLAAGLEAAHEKGIVHRDLKPANVILTADGGVKVLDFGLAKALAGEPTPAEPGAPSAAGGATREGQILGTVSYMSPEQARGQAVDRRTDVWAFGCVLYEALTGRRAFPGETIPDTLAAVLEREVDFAALPADTHSNVRSLLRRCLQKDPGRRLHDIADARIEIEEARAAPAGAPVAPGEYHEPARRGPSRARLTGVAVVAATALGFVIWLSAPPERPRPAPVRRFSFTPAEGARAAAISPDGTRIVYAAGTPPDTRLWVRALHQETPRVIEGTNGATRPFWSPDSDAIGFFAGGELRKVAARTGGVPTTLCRVPDERLPLGWNAGSWSPDGQSIVFTAGHFVRQRLYQVDARGGFPTLLIEPSDGEREKSFDSPHFLPPSPSGDRLLFRIFWGRESIVVVQNLRTGERQQLVSGDGARVGTVYAISGHLVHADARDRNALYALPVDPETLRPVGEAIRIVDGGFGSSHSVSADGSLVFVGPPFEHKRTQLVWRDRGGARLGEIGRPHVTIGHARLSPDDRQVAFLGLDDERSVRDIWLQGTTTASQTRLGRGLAAPLYPTWSPRGDRIAFSARPGGPGADSDMFVVAAEADETAIGLPRTAAHEFVNDWSPDGRYLVYTKVGLNSESQDLWYLDLEDASPTPALFGPPGSTANLAQFSPDGRFVAYLSRESGRSEVYVERFPEGGGRVQVSTDGACRMRWAGEEIFYVRLVGEGEEARPPFDVATLVAVPVRTTPSLSVGEPVELFEFPVGDRIAYSAEYDVSSDGQRFILPERLEAPRPPAIHVVENWLEEFKDRH